MPNLISVVCKNCGRKFDAKASRLKTKYGITYCSRECYVNYYKTHGGYPTAKPKAQLTCKRCGKVFERIPSRAGEKYCSIRCALVDVHRSRKGSHRTEDEKQRMRERFALHKRAVVEQSEVLKQQGFKVLIVDKLRPDIIARKGDKTYAIEVEFDKPDYEKYQGIQVFDDVIWILRSSKGDNPPFSISPG